MPHMVCQSCGHVIDYGDEFVRVSYGQASSPTKAYYHAGKTDYFHRKCDVAIRSAKKSA